MTFTLSAQPGPAAPGEIFNAMLDGLFGATSKIGCNLERFGVCGKRFAERRKIAFIDDRRACVYPRGQWIRRRGAPIFELVNGVVMQVVGKS